MWTPLTTGKIAGVTGDGTADDATAGWTLVQLADLLRRADERLLDALRTIGPDTHAGLGEDAALELDPSGAERLSTVFGEIADLGDRLRVLGDSLPEEPVAVRYEAIASAAADDLASGIAEPSRALLAARLLHVADGWPALAECLRLGETHADWHETTVAQLLRRFRGTDAEAVQEVLADAGIDDDATFAACPPERLAALASALEARAAERR